MTPFTPTPWQAPPTWRPPAPSPSPRDRLDALVVVLAVVLVVMLAAGGLGVAVVGSRAHGRSPKPVASRSGSPGGSTTTTTGLPGGSGGGATPVNPLTAPAVSAPPVTPKPQALPTSTIVARVDPALVDIDARIPYQGEISEGTGMVLTSNGVVLTNNHVVNGATSIEAISVTSGRRYTATVLGVDPSHDVAVIQLHGASGLATISVNGLLPLAGDPVVAIGNAGGVGGAPSVTTGTVLALDQAIVASGQNTTEQLYGLIETTAALQPGDSGGPLVDGSGHIVGMDTAASQASGSDPVVSFAIPIIDAQGVAQQIQEGQAGGGVSLGVPGFLGVVTAAETASGAKVTGVVAGGPAARAGIVAGDSIVAIDGTPVDTYSPLSPILQMYAPGNAVMVGWTDPEGRSHSASVVLQTGPAD